MLVRTDTVSGRRPLRVDQVNEVGTFDGHRWGLSHGHGHLERAKRCVCTVLSDLERAAHVRLVIPAGDGPLRLVTLCWMSWGCHERACFTAVHSLRVCRVQGMSPKPARARPGPCRTCRPVRAAAPRFAPGLTARHAPTATSQVTPGGVLHKHRGLPRKPRGALPRRHRREGVALGWTHMRIAGCEARPTKRRRLAALDFLGGEWGAQGSRRTHESRRGTVTLALPRVLGHRTA